MKYSRNISQLSRHRM